MEEYIIKDIVDIIRSNIYINIATCSSKLEPWNTPVYAVYDNKLNFYYRSWVNSRHSYNISNNPNVFITIYDSKRKLGTNNKKGIYIKAKAFELREEEEITRNIGKFTNNDLSAKDFIGNSVKRVYKIVPEELWINIKSESEVDINTKEMKTKIPINLIQKHL